MATIKIGDRVRVGTWDLPVFVKRIYFADGEGNECHEADAADQILELDWGQHGESRVFLHDEGRSWHQYINLN